MKIDWNTVPHGTGMRPGATRQALAGHHLSVVRVETQPNAQFDGRLHRHDNEQLLVMLRGSVTLQVGDERFEATTGELVFFPPSVYHGALAVGAEGAEYLEIFSPPRLDQLPGWLGQSPLEWHP